MNLFKASLALSLLMTLGMTSNVFATSKPLQSPSAAAGKKSDPLDTMPKDLTPAEQEKWVRWVAEHKEREEKRRQKRDQASQKNVEVARGA